LDQSNQSNQCTILFNQCTNLPTQYTMKKYSYFKFHFFGRLPWLSLCLFFFISIIKLQSQTDTIKLPQIEISSQRFDQLFVGQNDFQIDSTSLQQFENQSLSTLITAQTAIAVKAYGTGLATLSMRGMSAAQTAILWNGFDIRTASTGLNELGLFPTGFDQIRIKSGSSTALFGSGAIGGTLLLDSEAPAIKDFSAKIDQSFGSFGMHGTTLGLAGGKGRVTTSVQLQYQKADNDFCFQNYSEIGQPIQKQINAANRINNGLINFRMQIADNQLLKISTWLNDANRQSPVSMVSANNHGLQKDHSQRNMAEWIVFHACGTSRVRSAFFNEKLSYTNDAITDSRYYILTYINEAEHTRKISQNSLLRLGANYTYQSATNTNYEGLKTRKRLALFAAQTFEWKTGKTALNLRQEFADGQTNPFTFSLGSEQIVYKSASFLNKIQIRGAISKNFNRPALNDLYWLTVGNPNLRSENGWSQELGYDFILDKILLKFTGFHIKVNDWIQWSPQNTGIWQPYNLKNVNSKGLEIDLILKNKMAKWNSQFVVKYRLTHTQDDLFKGKQLIYIPRNTALLSWNLAQEKWNFRWTQTYSSQRYSTASNTKSTDGFTLSNANFQYKTKVLKSDLGLSLSVDNIFNQAYEVISFYPNAGRAYILKLNLAFKKRPT
jgi:vitamin B12 transporter